MRIPTVLAIALVLGGCADWSRETKIEESIYQTVSLADTLQAVQSDRRPECYHESAAAARGVLGSHPSSGAYVAWGVARGGIHGLVTTLLESHDAAPWTKRLWQAVTISNEAVVVRDNWSIGLRFGSATPPVYAPCLH